MDWLWKKLGVVSPEEMEGLRLPSGPCWAIAARPWDSVEAFSALPILAGEGSTLYLEGGSHSDEVSAFLDEHQVSPLEEIERGTIWPKERVFHLPATPAVFDGFAKLADHHAEPEICSHLILYRAGAVLADWYDAFDRDIYANITIPEETVRAFAEAVGGTYRIEGV